MIGPPQRIDKYSHANSEKLNQQTGNEKPDTDKKGNSQGLSAERS